MKIDRQSVVRRHAIEYTEPDPSSVVTVGNGDFAFTADITGMQTFTSFHDQAAARAEGRVAVNTATMTTWGWHEMPNPDRFVLQDAMSSYDTARGPVEYPDKFDMAAMMGGGEVTRELRAGTWLNVNPHRLDLGRIGLVLRPARDAAPESDPAVLARPRQRLDLWSGVVESTFEYAGQQVRVTTVADPARARVAFRIESGLLATGQAAVSARFPYASDGFFETVQWSATDKHTSQLRQLGQESCLFDRILDDSTYSLRLDWSQGGITATDRPHEFELATPADALEVVAGFAPDSSELAAGDFDTVRRDAARWWSHFWTTGAAIDFSGSTDPRATELERRVVLSQYLTAVHCAGSTPPQETGLTTNSWQGKFHLEMHWWHAAHFATWGRPELLERSMDWYLSILDAARETARRQQYAGARWPKQVGPDGRESPSDIGALLIWQQPHPLYLLELLHRSTAPDKHEALLTRFAELVEETALFMASFAEARDGRYHLPAPLVPAQEFYDATTTEDPTFELAYWWWGLEIAQQWRERLGRKRNEQWQQVQDGLVPPRQDAGVYSAIATEPYLRRDDHPSMLCALGVVPTTPHVDPAVVEATLLDVRDNWDWNSAWGWDFPAMAMTATRVGRPDLAVDALLQDSAKNQYLPSGHSPQIGSILPIYLPANGALLAAVSLMAAGWQGAAETPGFPREGWTVRHEGFVPWP